MRRLAAAALALAAEAAPASGAPLRHTLPGRGFCTGSDQAARKYVGAATQHDRGWLESLSDCRRLAAGLAAEVLRVFPEPDGTPPVAKARLRGRGEVGHTVFVARPR